MLAAGGGTHSPWIPSLEERNISDTPVWLGQDFPCSEPHGRVVLMMAERSGDNRTCGTLPIRQGSRPGPHRARQQALGKRRDYQAGYPQGPAPGEMGALAAHSLGPTAQVLLSLRSPAGPGPPFRTPPRLAALRMSWNQSGELTARGEGFGQRWVGGSDTPRVTWLVRGA